MTRPRRPTFDPPPPVRPGRYKYVIAFENYYSTDYVSERFYQGLLSGAVPVSLGAPNIRSFSPGAHSYIDARAFATPEALASFLVAQADYPARLAAYHAWRAAGPSESFRRLMGASMTRAEVYGEGKHHGCQHRVDLRRLHQAIVARARSRQPELLY